MIEAQWFMFGLVFLLCAPWTLQEQGHVRVDILYTRLPPRWPGLDRHPGRTAVSAAGLSADRLGCLGLFPALLPPERVVLQPRRALVVADEARDPGRLRLLAAQGLSEIIKGVAALLGHRPLPDALGEGTEMEAWLAANLAPVMFSALVLFLLIGYPVAFSLAAVGMLFGWIGIELGLLTPALLQALPDRVFGIMRNEILLAVPFFTFMGLILERSGMAEELLDTVGQIFGGVRGGLAYAVIFVGALLAATTGVVAASVIAMGLISLPIMLRYGYHRPLAAGVIAASGTLAQIIPPSLVLIVMADVLGRSVGDMYKGALMPGLLLTGLLCALCLRQSPWCAPTALPPLPPRRATLHGRALAMRVVIALIPPLALIFLVLGTIFIGWATPTEGGAMGAVGALLLAVAKGRLNLDVLVQSMATTAKITSFVVFILIGSSVFSLTFRGRERGSLGGAPADRAAGRGAGISDLRQSAGLPAGVLPRFLRDRLHHPAAAGAGGGEARHRSGLVRGADRGQHADQLHASAIRLRALLSALGRPARRSAPPTSTGGRCPSSGFRS